MTTVYGKILAANGRPYEGALIKFHLNKDYRTASTWVTKAETRAFTNVLGRFEVQLPETTGDNFYHLTIIHDTVLVHAVTIPHSTQPINFVDLPEYLYPYERLQGIGDC